MYCACLVYVCYICWATMSIVHKLPGSKNVTYNVQTKFFWVKIRGLNGTRFNPKTKLTVGHICEADIEEVFGKVSKYKTTNTKLHQDTKKNLRLCSQIYGTSTITNNEIMSWVVKGYIGQRKSIYVNWEKEATSTAKEKVC